MKNIIVGINQPYYLPYIGFFDRMKACDVFVINNYYPLNRKGTHHKRVKIIQLKQNNEKDGLYLIEKIGKKVNKKLFNKIVLGESFWKSQKDHIDTLYRTYRRGPGFEYTKKLLEQMEDDSCLTLGEYNLRLIVFLADRLGLKDKILDITKEKSFPKEIFTKKRKKNQSNKATYCNLMTCKFFGANLHIAGQNGPLWLDEKEFVNNNIDVLYQKVAFVEYRQYPQNELFLNGLSVVDLLFNCGESAKNIIGCGSTFVDRETLLRTTKLTGR
jgi:hypothetical protein